MRRRVLTTFISNFCDLFSAYSGTERGLLDLKFVFLYPGVPLYPVEYFSRRGIVTKVHEVNDIRVWVGNGDGDFWY